MPPPVEKLLERFGGLPTQPFSMEAWESRHRQLAGATYLVIDWNLNVVHPITEIKFRGNVCAVLFVNPGVGEPLVRFNERGAAAVPIPQEFVIGRHFDTIHLSNPVAGGVGTRLLMLLDRDLTF